MSGIFRCAEDNFISKPEIGSNVQLLLCHGLSLLPLLSSLVGNLIERLPKSLLYNNILSSRGGDPTSPSSGARYIDPRFKRVLWYLIGSTKGGSNRAKILKQLNERPANPNQLSTALELDYKTVLHHLKVLSENGLVVTDNKDRYGAIYFLTPMMESNFHSFREILEKIRDH